MNHVRALAIASFSIFVSMAACGGSDAAIGKDADAGSASDASSGGGDRDSGGTTRDGGSSSGSDSGTKDSGTVTGSFGCAGASLPTSAPASITVAGTAYEQTGSTPPATLAGASISAYPTQTSTTASDTKTSNGAGAFSLTVGTGGVPVDGYLKATKAGDEDTYLYPNAPLANDVSNLRVLMLTTTVYSFLPSLVGVTQGADKGLVGVIVLDCDGNPVQGATISSSPAGEVRYNDASGPSQTASSTAADGIAYIFNAPTGDVTLSAAAGGVTLRSHHFVSRANAFTTTLITP